MLNVPSFIVFTANDKISIIASSVISGIAGYGFTQRWSFTIVAATLGALITALPRIIVALTGSRKTFSQVIQTELAAMAKELSLERDVTRLVRTSKHNLQSELQKCSNQIDLLEGILNQHNIQFPIFRRKDGVQLTEFEDIGLKVLFENKYPQISQT